jgi:uncharacterized protein (DUF1501 family)
MKTPICTGFETSTDLSRRQLLNKFGMGLGGLALADLLGKENATAASGQDDTGKAGILGTGHIAPKAKRVIYLFMSGGPSQMDLLDYKPMLNKHHGEELPDSVRKGQRLTGMSGNQSSLPMVGSPFKFSQHGQAGAWFSEILPHTASIADDITVIRSMHTDAINHGPGVTFFQTGSQIPGRPSIGAWLDYGLGRANENLPSFVVMVTKNKGGQPLGSPLWGAGFLPAKHQGILFRSGNDPVLYLSNPKGQSSTSRRKMLNRLEELHAHQFENTPDAAIQDRIDQYEMSYRMQSSVPEATDIQSEPDWVFDMYGKGARDPGSFAANCLQARRLAERGVKFIQLYHQGWDQHGGLPGGLRNQANETDQASAALVKDLKMRGLLEDTLVVWGGEFGRTNYCQGKLSTNFGRDHHPRCFSTWMAGGGIKAGATYGETDDFCYNIQSGGVHVHDFHATMMHQLGIDHERLTYKFQGRRYRLTDVHGHIVKGILA